jgi:Zn finger protein HypA/HybF involved in hydrogenase expression
MRDARRPVPVALALELMPPISQAIEALQSQPRDALHDLLAEWLIGDGGLEAGLPLNFEAARASGWDVAAIEEQFRAAWPREVEARKSMVDRALVAIIEVRDDPTAPGAAAAIGALLDAGLSRHVGRKVRRTFIHAVLDDVLGIRRGPGFRVCERCDVVYLYERSATSRFCEACGDHDPTPGTLAPGERVRWEDWADPANRRREWIRTCADCGAEFTTTDQRTFYCESCGSGARKVARHRERARRAFSSPAPSRPAVARPGGYVTVEEAAAIAGLPEREFLEIAIDAGLPGVVRDDVVMFHRRLFEIDGWWKPTPSDQ